MCKRPFHKHAPTIHSFWFVLVRCIQGMTKFVLSPFFSKVLSSYISPNPQRSGDPLTAVKDASGDVSTEHLQSIFPEVFRELLSNSCLIPAISSYLMNDSGKKRMWRVVTEWRRVTKLKLGAQVHDSANCRIHHLGSSFSTYVQLRNFCTSCVCKDCLVTRSTHAHKQKFPANP